MTAPYKKRAKAGWNSDKKQSNKDERVFEKHEIRTISYEELNADAEIEHNDKLPKKKKRKQPKPKDILNKINSTEKTLAFFKSGSVYRSEWIKGVISRYEKELEDLHKQYNEMTSKT
jgi:hypothetical protein